MELDLGIQMLNPTGTVMKARVASVRGLESLSGKRVGYLFNQHGTATAFWKTLEQGVEKTFHPAAVCRLYKENTWAPAAQSDVDRLVRDTDYALVGVGA